MNYQPKVAIVYNFTKHPSWQDLITKIDFKYNLIFLDSKSMSRENILAWLKAEEISGLISEFMIMQHNNVSLEEVRNQIIRSKSSKMVKIISHEKDLDMHIICQGKNDWVLDLNSKGTVNFLKKMPRTCAHGQIITTSDITNFKQNNYLKNILEQVKTITISDFEVLQKAFRLFQKKYKIC